MEKGQCKLCLNENVDLLTRSHIIPKFLFEDMKDENNSFIQIEPNKYVKGRKQHIKKPRDAFHESNILCGNCDGIVLKEYEDYLKLVFHSTTKSVSRPLFVKRVQEKRGFNILHIENVNYKLYKLGFLSILWRASISNLNFFNIVNLGPHSELIRKILLKGEQFDESEYPFFTSFFNQINDEYQVVLPITKFKMYNYTHYRFIINGLDIIFMIGGKDLKMNPNLLEYVPNFQGKLKIIEHKENYGKDMILSIINKNEDFRAKY